jgi:pyrimidine-nucleoside phosphorylase
MNVYEVIKKKRDGYELSTDEIKFIIDGFLDGQVREYQMAAFLMSVYFNSMSKRECLDLTLAMADSGEKVDLSEIDGFIVDKHSTGGVGDKTTLVLAPLVAATGGIVAKMTGRELGHTGGTVDKLESIPGLNLGLSREKFIEVVNRIHVSLIAQTADLAHADKHIYALRNVTATVDSIPLIASSIMSKKIAAGSDGVVLDVKTGRGAFTQTYNEALELARTMVDIGEGAGRRMVAIVTSMEQPLGYTIGNAIELEEAINTLIGKGPKDLEDLVMELGSHMLLLSGVVSTGDEAIDRLRATMETGKGFEKLCAMIEAQGGTIAPIKNPKLLPQPKLKLEVKSEGSGYVQKIDALEVGLASMILGAGRKTKDETIDHSIGIMLKKKVGDKVKEGEPLALFYSDGDSKKIEQAKEKFLKAYHIGSKKVEPPKFFYAKVSREGIVEY